MNLRGNSLPKVMGGLLLPLFCLVGSMLFTSCEETAGIDEYANWQERNEALIRFVADSVKINSDGEWRRILSFKLDSVDAQGNPIEHGVEDYIYCQIVSRDLYATRWREARSRVTHNVVGHLVGRAAVSVCRFNVIAIAVIIEASELRCVQRIHIMTAIQTEAVDHVLLHILVETHARNLFEDCSGEVQTQI